jgi:hypothetical protein
MVSAVGSWMTGVHDSKLNRVLVEVPNSVLVKKTGSSHAPGLSFPSSSSFCFLDSHKARMASSRTLLLLLCSCLILAFFPTFSRATLSAYYSFDGEPPPPLPLLRFRFRFPASRLSCD